MQEDSDGRLGPRSDTVDMRNLRGVIADMMPSIESTIKFNTLTLLKKAGIQVR